MLLEAVSDTPSGAAVGLSTLGSGAWVRNVGAIHPAL